MIGVRVKVDPREVAKKLHIDAYDFAREVGRQMVEADVAARFEIKPSAAGSSWVIGWIMRRGKAALTSAIRRAVKVLTAAASSRRVV